MTIESWWSRLDARDQEWLIAHNGEAISEDVLRNIAGAGGLICASGEWAGETRPDGFHLCDDAVDWIEAVANGEVPEARRPGRRVAATGRVAVES